MTTVGVGEQQPTVLIVEDEQNLADYYAKLLEDDYTVKVAYRCEAARDLLTADVDVALLDRQLPNGHGDDLIATIRERNLDCRVAMVTAVEPGLDIIELGFDEYLCKPVPKEELRGTVARLLAQADYGKLLEEFYTVASKKALLETHHSADELAASDEYAALEERYRTLQDQLSQKAAAFTDRQFTAELARCDT